MEGRHRWGTRGRGTREGGARDTGIGGLRRGAAGEERHGWGKGITRRGSSEERWHYRRALGERAPVEGTPVEGRQ